MSDRRNVGANVDVVVRVSVDERAAANAQNLVRRLGASVDMSGTELRQSVARVNESYARMARATGMPRNVRVTPPPSLPPRMNRQGPILELPSQRAEREAAARSRAAGGSGSRPRPRGGSARSRLLGTLAGASGTGGPLSSFGGGARGVGVDVATELLTSQIQRLPGGPFVHSGAEGALLGARGGPWGALGGAAAGVALEGVVQADKKLGATKALRGLVGWETGTEKRAFDDKRLKPYIEQLRALDKASNAIGLRLLAGHMRTVSLKSNEGKESLRRLTTVLYAAARAADQRNIVRSAAAITNVQYGPKYSTVPTFLRRATADIGRLPLAARNASAAAAVELARGMERNGRLPRGATRRIVRQLGREYGGLRGYLRRAGLGSVRAIDATMRDRRVLRSARMQINGVRALWDDFPRMARTTSLNAADHWITTMRFLRRKIRTTTGEQKQDALEQWRLMQRGAGRIADHTADAWQRSMRRISRLRIFGLDVGGAVTGLLRGVVGDGSSDGGGNPLAGLVRKAAGAAVDGWNRFKEEAGKAGNAVRNKFKNIFAGGGVVARGATGGIFSGSEFAPALVSSGEQVVHGGRAWTVPGTRVAADNVFAMLPVGAAVLTDHGQSLMSGGASLDDALAMQLPHFAAGGVVPGYRRGARRHAKRRPWVRVGGTTYDDSPPGAFGDDLVGFAELGTATRGGIGTGRGWLAKAFGWSGELKAGAPVEFRHGGRTIVLRKRDRGYGQGGDGTTSDATWAADFWRSSASGIGIGGTWKGMLHARPADGSASPARGSGDEAARWKAARITRPRLVDILQPSVGDAFQQGFALGLERTRRMFRTWRGTDSDFFTSALEGIRSTADDRRRKISGGRSRGGAAAPATGSQRRRVRAMLAAGRRIAGLPYFYGGGHGGYALDKRGYDCSGAVSYLLHAGGFLDGPPMTTDGLKTFGAEGHGRAVTVAVRGSTGRNAHTMIRIGRHFFEAGGGGVGWRSGWTGSWDMFRHPVGFRRGGAVPPAGDPRRRPGHPRFVGWGLRSGGTVERFRGGGRVGRTLRAAERAHSHAAEQLANQVGRQVEWDATGLQGVEVRKIGEAGLGKGQARRVVEMMRRLGETLQETGKVTWERLGNLRVQIHSQIKDLHRGGLTGRERVQVRRLRSTLSLVEAEMGNRVGTWVARGQEALEAVGRRSERKSRSLRRQGIAEDSVIGLRELNSADEKSRDALRASISGKGGLEEQLKRAKKMRDPAAVKAIREQLDASRDAMAELEVSIIERGRAIQSVIIQEALDAGQKRVDDAGRSRQHTQNALIRSGVDPNSSAGISKLREADQHTANTIADVLGSQSAGTGLYAQLKAARDAKNPELAKSIESMIDGYVDQLDQLNTDIYEAAKQASAAAAQELVDKSAFQSGVSSSAKERFEIQQRMAELNGGPKFDSAQAREARAAFIRSTIVPALKAEEEALRRQAETAKAERGENDETYRQAHLAYLAKQNEIASAELEAAQEIKGNTEDAAEQLKQLGGQLTFSFNGQAFTDVINSGIGA